MNKKTINFIFEQKIDIPQSNFTEGNFPILTGNLIDKLRKRKDWIFITAFSPDGIHFASGGFNSNILLWNIFKEKPLDSLSGHEDWIIALAFSHDGKYLLSGSRDNNIILWSVQERKLITKFEGHQNRISSLAFSPDDSLIASGGYDSTIKIWALDSKKPIKTIDTSPLWPTSICFASKNLKLIAGFNDGTIIIYNLNNYFQTSVIKVFQNWIDSIKCSKDELLFYASNTDGFIKILETKTSKLIFSKKIPFKASLFPYNEKSLNFVDNLSIYMMLYERSPENFLKGIRNYNNNIESYSHKIFLKDYKDFAFDFSKNSDIIACSERSNYIYIFNSKTQDFIKIDISSSWIKALSISDDGNLLAAGGYDGEIKIFSLKTGYLISSIIDHASWINSLKFSTGSKLIAAGLEDGTILIIKIKDMEVVEKFNLSNSIYKLDFFNNNKFVLVSTIDGNLFRIDLANKEIELIQKLNNSWISNFALLNTEKAFITASEDGYLYLIENNKVINSNKIHDSEITMLELLDDNTLLTGSLDLFLKQVNLTDLKVVSEKRFDGLPLAYNKNFNKLFISHFRNISIYNRTDSQELGNPELNKPTIEFNFDFNSKQFNISKDCEILFILKGNNQLEKISLTNLNALFQIKPLEPIVTFCNSFDFSKLVTGHFNSEIKVYDTEKNQIIKELKSYEGSIISSINLSIDESFLLVGFEDGTIELWLFNEEKNLWCISNNSEPISKLTFSYDKLFFISKNKYSLDTDLWSTIEGTKLGTFPNKNFCFKSFAFSPNSESVLYLNDKNQLSIWFLKEGKEITIPEKKDEPFITYFSYSPDSSKIVVGYIDGTLQIFSLEGELIKEEDNKSSSITFILFKDEKSFFTSHLDGSIRIHTLEDFLDIEPIFAHHSSIDFLSYNAEKNLLASYSTIEHTLKAWNL
ncbi:WD40 repeat-containing protein [Thermodesulfobium narugense DSM 14796]|uniref:WD40 repeat-containing protein n=1 Tax=Thermodesulfobium narugense DSM 14796 TaxID=747365 RepID=M1E938_9BACT|nr:WD40 repeat domain-containing protein [Thermodesulfobium narugense]AEE14839.1 WD40 repeat-containing protein [Thermodesulfobium narugense DSM 14796]